ncbi:Crp/Fnr family transcriptional regulator [Pseudaminobacter sp. 19-2017]|uniref:Crp/Fnr family transcriptional regulator n=1 Tax=Pseudaminobacter soli (ex Zhang et al. 2022) TaxID=2831468 RepID=A0A942E3Y3_9HYPH|nr:Crp/Fnr family transcriptional regulator [Pseudaminobacter soli]MBS3650693.1 Crp/Fnr family transcriptional regulator [Pseudaminobacter soli]
MTNLIRMIGESDEVLARDEVWNPRVKNRLLSALPAKVMNDLWPGLEPVELRKKQILHYSGGQAEYVHFIEDGLVSVSARASAGKWIEVWLIGSEGMTGVPIVLGDKDKPPFRRIVQVGGNAYRMMRADFQQVMTGHAVLRRLLLRYAEYVLLQACQAHVCDAQHPLKQRLGRWLLLARDGLGRDELPLTHQMLARLLGVRRASVSECLRFLESEATIRTGRGVIHIADPRQLQSCSCGCYGLIRSEYQRLIP